MITAYPHSNSSVYTVNVVDQSDDYDLLLSLNSSIWGFQPYPFESTITITIDGFTPNPMDDGDLLIVFAIGDLQYFSFFAHLDSSYNIKSQIYYNFDNDIPVSQWISSDAIQTRWNRVSNNGQWIPLHNWNQQALWPLKFVINNVPLHNWCNFQFYHNKTESLATWSHLPSSFMPNKNMDVYIMGDSNGERYIVSEFNIKSYYNYIDIQYVNITIPLPVTTPTPTQHPTQFPSAFEHHTTLDPDEVTIITKIGLGAGFDVNYTKEIIQIIEFNIDTYFYLINNSTLNCVHSNSTHHLKNQIQQLLM